MANENRERAPAFDRPMRSLLSLFWELRQAEP